MRFPWIINHHILYYQLRSKVGYIDPHPYPKGCWAMLLDKSSFEVSMSYKSQLFAFIEKFKSSQIYWKKEENEWSNLVVFVCYVIRTRVKSDSWKIEPYINCLCDFIMTFLANPHFILQISHTKTFKWSILGANTIILSKNIHKVTKRDYV